MFSPPKVTESQHRIFIHENFHYEHLFSATALAHFTGSSVWFQNTWYGRNPYLSAVVQSFGRIFFSTEFANSRFPDANDHTITSSFITSKSSRFSQPYASSLSSCSLKSSTSATSLVFFTMSAMAYRPDFASGSSFTGITAPRTIIPSLMT